MMSWNTFVIHCRGFGRSFKSDELAWGRKLLQDADSVAEVISKLKYKVRLRTNTLLYLELGWGGGATHLPHHRGLNYRRSNSHANLPNSFNRWSGGYCINL